jgi:hypothetical protein
LARTLKTSSERLSCKRFTGNVRFENIYHLAVQLVKNFFQRLALAVP